MILKIILAVLLLLPAVVSASKMKNTCWVTNSNNDFSVTLTTGSFSSSKAGSTATFNYSGVPLYYNAICWADYVENWDGSRPGLAWYYRTEIDLPPSDFGNGFYKVNEDFDVKIYLAGAGAHEVPTNGIWSGYGAEYPVDPGIYSFQVAYFGGATNSTITLRLRRDQLGGVLSVPTNVKLFRGYRSLWSQTVFNDTPIMSMSIAGQYIPVPIVCTINNGAAIEVDFGDIDNTKLSSDGSRYAKTIPLQYRCNTAVTQNVDINLIAAPAAFSSELIATTLPDDVGIMVSRNGQVVKPNQKFSTALLDGFGQDELQVAPVARDLTKSITGSFTASATLIMSVQ